MTTEPLGIVEAVTARRLAVLSTASPAARRRILGLPPVPVLAPITAPPVVLEPPPAPRATEAPPWHAVIAPARAPHIVPWPWLPGVEAPPRPSLAEQRKRIAEAICFIYEIPIAQFFSDTRRADIARPRQAAMWIAFHWLGMTTTPIGKWLGGRDHTTVLHGLKNHEMRMQFAMHPPYVLNVPQAKEWRKCCTYADRFRRSVAMLADMQPLPPTTA